MSKSRLQQIKSLPSLWTADRRSEEEAIEIFREALKKSKGACNNRMGWLIAQHKDSTVDEIIKFGKETDSIGGQSKAFDSLHHFRKTPYERKLEREESRRVTVRDTYLKTYLEGKGLWDEKTDSKFGGLLSDHWKNSGTMTSKEFCRLLNYAKYADVKTRFTETCGNVIRRWMEQVNLDVIVGKPFTESRKQLFDKETEWLSHAPDSVLNTLATKEVNNTQNFTQAVFNTGLFSTYSETPRSIEVCELSKAFQETMDHIGLGIADTQTENHTHSFPQIRIGIKNLMKKVISMNRTFAKLVRDGFDPKLARDEVIDQLNQYVITSQMKINWQFFALDNAPTAYDDYKPKAKARKTGGNTSVRPSHKPGSSTSRSEEIPGFGKVISW